MHAKRGQLALGLMLVAALATLPHVAAGADRAPTTAPTKGPLRELERAKRLVAQLADENYDRREAARVELMAFKRADLASIREAVRQNLPLAPSQLSVLREIVTQVYLSGDVYLPDEGRAGFLGVSLPVLGRPEDRGLLSIERGVAITSRVPGFCAYRMLQNGDVLLALTFAGDRAELNTVEQLQEAVSSVKAGQTVTFEVLRQGRVLKVPITLDVRPFNLTPVVFQEFTARRTDQADEYWQRDFAPLLPEKLI